MGAQIVEQSGLNIVVDREEKFEASVNCVDIEESPKTSSHEFFGEKVYLKFQICVS
jgi:hypothetical protein